MGNRKKKDTCVCLRCVCCVCARCGLLRLHRSGSKSISHSAFSLMRLVRDGYFVSPHPSSEFCLLYSCVQSESLNYNPQIKHKQEELGSHSYAAVSGAFIRPVFIYSAAFLAASSFTFFLVLQFSVIFFYNFLWEGGVVVLPVESKTFLLFNFNPGLHQQVFKCFHFNKCLNFDLQSCR